VAGGTYLSEDSSRVRLVVAKIFKYVGIAIGSVIVVLVSSALLYRKYLQHEVAEARAITSPSGIDSLEAVQIGGIQQWIEVRGQNVNNPILLFVHGGPAIAFMPMGSSFQDPWEKYFTVVQWDQRGAGKTYETNDKELLRRTMNVARMEQDAADVLNYLRNRFHRERYLSWVTPGGACWDFGWPTNIRNGFTRSWEPGKPSACRKTKLPGIASFCKQRVTATTNWRSKNWRALRPIPGQSRFQQNERGKSLGIGITRAAAERQ
jgi:hypothetical protein